MANLEDSSFPDFLSNSTTSNSTLSGQRRLHLEWSDRATTAFWYGLFAGCGIFTNSLPIILTFATKLRKNRVNIMVANMSSADLLECLVALSGQNLYILYRETLPEVGCQFLGFLQLLMAVQVFVFPPFLSLNSPKRMLLCVVVSWALSTIIPFAFLMGGQAKYDEDNEHCCIVTKGSLVWSVVYWIVIIVPLVGCCDGTVMYCNLKIFQRLRDHGAVRKLDANVVRQNREMLLFMIVDMVCPVIAHTVYHVSKFAYVDRRIVFFRRIFSCMLIFNSTMRGVVTVSMLGPYRRECKRILAALCPGRFGNENCTTVARPTYQGNTWAAPSVIGRGQRLGAGSKVEKSQTAPVMVIAGNQRCIQVKPCDNMDYDHCE